MGVLAADAEVDRDVEAAGVDALHLFQDVEVDLFQLVHETLDSFCRGAGLVLIIGIVFLAIAQTDGFLFHGDLVLRHLGGAY